MADGAAQQPKQTIVVVHGTFSAPSAEAPKWWQPNATDAFIPKLNSALERRGAHVRCWSNCGETSTFFQWTGHNNWLDRTHAAAALVSYLTELAKEGWTCHLIGHSHGGNVIADALHGLKDSPASAAVGRVVTLGTPFIDTVSGIERQRGRTRWRIRAVGFLCFLLLVLLPVVKMLTTPLGRVEEMLSVSLPVLVIGGLVLGAKALYRWLRRARGVRAGPIVALAIGSRYDEAWQLLHHLRETPNPLADKRGIRAYLAARIRDYRRRRSDIARIYGATRLQDLPPLLRVVVGVAFAAVLVGPCALLLSGPSVDPLGLVALTVIMWPFFYLVGLLCISVFTFGSLTLISAYLWPVRYLGFMIGSLAIIPNEVGTYIARRQSWRLLQTLALGLDGYRFELPQVRMQPEHAGAAQFAFEPLGPNAEARALAARADWIQRNFGSASDTFSKLVLSAADVSSLLDALAKDQSLVHAAYYADDECIERIADFIGGAHVARAAA